MQPPPPLTPEQIAGTATLDETAVSAAAGEVAGERGAAAAGRLLLEAEGRSHLIERVYHFDSPLLLLLA